MGRNFRDKSSRTPYNCGEEIIQIDFDMGLQQLPSNIEEGIEKFAEQRHISHDEAIIELLETGLRHGQSIGKIKGLSGEPMSDEEAEVVDDALTLAMDARRQRSEWLKP